MFVYTIVIIIPRQTYCQVNRAVELLIFIFAIIVIFLGNCCHYPVRNSVCWLSGCRHTTDQLTQFCTKASLSTALHCWQSPSKKNWSNPSSKGIWSEQKTDLIPATNWSDPSGKLIWSEQQTDLIRAANWSDPSGKLIWSEQQTDLIRAANWSNPSSKLI